jgi:hypothetical protein
VERGRELTSNERDALATIYADAHPAIAGPTPPSSRPEPERQLQTRQPLWGPAKVLRLKIQRQPREP